MTTPSTSSLLDAHAIDRELLDALQRQWDRACSYLGAGFCLHLQPELHALLRAVLWQFSVGSGVPTPGQAMQGLSCTAVPTNAMTSGPMLVPPGMLLPVLPLQRWQRVGHFLAAVGFPWIWARATRAAVDPEHPERLRLLRSMRRVEAVLQLLGLLCSVRLLRSSRSPTLPMALLGIQLIQTAGVRNAADVDFMNQELALRVIADLLVGFRPMWNSATPTRQLAARGHAKQQSGRYSLSTLFGGLIPRWLMPQQTETHEEPQPMLEHGCGFCFAQPPHTPTHAACGHAFCYYCISVARTHDANTRCPRCDKKLTIDSSST